MKRPLALAAVSLAVWLAAPPSAGAEAVERAAPAVNAVPAIVGTGARRTFEPPVSGAVLPQAYRYVVVGAGDVVKNYYSQAFRDLKEKYAGGSDISVTFIDHSASRQGNPQAEEKAAKIIAELKSWGANVLDAAKEDDVPAIAALRPDVTIVAVPDALHVQKVMEWLDRPDRPKRIYVEKPLDRDRKKALALLNRVGYGQDQVLVLDHYSARLLPSEEQLDMINHHLGGGVKKLAYYFLEDHSGADPNHVSLADRDGAIEREQRVGTLDGGMILDGLPHFFPLARYFADLERIHVTGLRAGQYTGVDGDPDKRTEIHGETFAEVRMKMFRLPSIYGTPASAVTDSGPVDVEAYVGKGVRGVKALGSEFDRNVKLLRVWGLNGRTIDFDLRSASPDDRHARAYLLGRDGKETATFPLYAKPYKVLFERMLWGVHDALHVEDAERILEVIERITMPIREQKVLPAHPGGMKGRRESSYVEELDIPWIFKHDQ